MAELWAAFYPAKYRVSAALLRQNTVDCNRFDWGASMLEYREGDLVGFVGVKKAPAGLYRFPDPDQYHLSSIAFTDPLVGVELLWDVKRILRNRGATRLVFGQDLSHFWPGAPMDVPRLINFLEVEGFQGGGLVHDLEADLREYQPRHSLSMEAAVTPLSDHEVPALDQFLLREFPGRWRYDVLRMIGQNGPQVAQVLRVGGRLEGFAMIQSSSTHQVIGGAVWQQSLGEHWGALGPIGVSEAVRGQGLGGQLLEQSLLELKRRGVHRCIIDWTGLTEFYGKYGFSVTRTYRGFSLDLDESAG